MNTTKTIVSLFLLAAFSAHAGEVHDARKAVAVADKGTGAMQQVAIDESDNRGMSLLFDDKYKPGQLIVSSVSGYARKAGVQPDDVLKIICTKPSSMRHADIPAGAEVSQGCAPVRTIAEKVRVVDPFAHRRINGRLVNGNEVPMEYHFERDGVPVIVRNLTASNPPQKIVSRN